MRTNSNCPKIFSIYIEKGDKFGFLRLRNHEKNGKILYLMTIVKDYNDASKFVNFNNVKNKALKYSSIYKFDEIKIYDEKIEKYYHVKQETKNKEK